MPIVYLFLICLLFFTGCSQLPSSQSPASASKELAAKLSSESEDLNLVAQADAAVSPLEESTVKQPPLSDFNQSAAMELGSRNDGEINASGSEIAETILPDPERVETAFPEPKIEQAVNDDDNVEWRGFEPPREEVVVTEAVVMMPEEQEPEKESIVANVSEVDAGGVKLNGVEPEVTSPVHAETGEGAVIPEKSEVIEPLIAHVTTEEREPEKESIVASESEVGADGVELNGVEPEATSPVHAETEEEVVIPEKPEVIELPIDHATTKEPKLEVSVASKEEEGAGQRVPTQLTVVSTSNTPLCFFSGSQLHLSVPPERARAGAVPYIGSSELDLWQSPSGVPATESTVMECVGSFALSGDTSNYLLLCASQPELGAGNVFRFLLLAEGFEHIPEGHMCLVNLTGADVRAKVDALEIIIPSQSHYDVKLNQVSRRNVRIVVDIPRGERGVIPAMSGGISDPSQRMITIVPSESSLADEGALRIVAVGSSPIPQRILTVPDQTPAVLETANETKRVDQLPAREPYVTPATRTY